MIEDDASTYVKPAEYDGTEVDGPDIGGDLLETDVVATEQVGDVDPGGPPTDAPVGRDLAGLEVSRVLGREELRRKGSCRGLIDRSGRPLAMRFVRPDFVEVDSPGVEAALLS